MNRPKSNLAFNFDSTSNKAADSVTALLDQVKAGSLSVEQASALLARQTPPDQEPRLTHDSSAIPHSTPPWSIVGGNSETAANTSTSWLYVDCATPEKAKLVLDIQRQLSIQGQVCVGYPASPLSQALSCSLSDSPRVLIFSFSNLENFPSLVDRLGWPPPKPIVNSWLAQLADWKAMLLARGWPLEHGSADDLMIDSQAQIVWPWLSIRIAQSMLSSRSQRNSDSTESPSIALAPSIALEDWSPISSDENLLPAITRINQLLAFQPNTPQLTEPAASATASATVYETVNSADILAAAKPSKRTPKTQRSHGKLLRGSLLATAISAVLGLSLWQLYPSADPARQREKSQVSAAPSARQPGSAGLFNSQGDSSPTDTLNTSAQATATATEPLQLQTLSTAPQNPDRDFADSESSLQTIAEDLGIVQFNPSSFTGPTIDLQSEGFGTVAAEPLPSTTRASSATRAELDTAREFPTPSNGIDAATDSSPTQTVDTVQTVVAAGVGKSEVSHSNGPTAATKITAKFVRLPDREDTSPLELPFEDQIQTQQLSLQLPSAATWKFLPNEAADRLAIVPSGNPSIDVAVAIMTWSDSDGKAMPIFQWTSLAANNPGAESLRNARLLGSGTPIYWRVPETIEPLAVELSTTPRQWPLKTLPDTKQTTTTLKLFDRQHDADQQKNNADAEPAESDPLVLQWLLPVDGQPGRKPRGLVEISQSEEAPVKIRLRADLQIGRLVEFETIAIASLDPTEGWIALDQQTIPTTLDRLAIVKQNLSTTLNLVRQQYSAASNKDLKSLLRRKRDYLEQQEAAISRYGERLAELQILLGRIETELAWQLLIATTWPDDQQTILASEIP